MIKKFSLWGDFEFLHPDQQLQQNIKPIWDLWAKLEVYILVYRGVVKGVVCYRASDPLTSKFAQVFVPVRKKNTDQRIHSI